MVVVMLLFGCGRLSFDEERTAPDAPSLDRDASIGDCWNGWRTGAPVIATPQPVTTLNTSASEQDVFVAGDVVYFTSDRAPTHGGRDLWIATRGSGLQLRVIDRVANVSSPGDEGLFQISQDGRFAWFASSRSSNFDIFTASRPTALDAFVIAQDGLANINTPSSEHDPLVTPDGLSIYFARQLTTQRDLFVAQRASVADAFSAPVPLAVNDPVSDDGDPTVSPDGRVIVFSSRRGGAGNDIYVAIRTDAALPFGAPRLLAEVSSPGSDHDTMLTADGCELWFASDRAGSQDLYVATVLPAE